MTYNPEIHHRRSIRLKEYDYSRSGAYFVTMCAWKKENLFGEIKNGEMLLNEHGAIVANEWLNTGIIRTNVDLDEYIVMPNHFHGIMVINDCDPVGARRCLARSEMATDAEQTNGQNRATHRIAPTMQSGTIGSIIGQFKSIATKRINQVRNTPGTPLWQRNYYEHIIRDDRELHAIREYIRYNPLKWEEDDENPNMKRAI